MKEFNAVVICTITEFCIGIPVAYWLAYYMKFGVIGIWLLFLLVIWRRIGWNFGITLTCFAFAFTIGSLDWKK